MKKFILAGALLTLALLIFLFNRPTSESLPSNMLSSEIGLIAEVYETSGDVKINTGEGTEKKFSKGTLLNTGDTIKTGADGQITLEFYSGARTALDTNTTLLIDETSIDSTNWKKQRVHLSLVAGRVWSRVLRLLDSEAIYEVNYNGVVSGVRGTAFSLTGQSQQNKKLLSIDEFDGTIKIGGKVTGALRTGFSISFDTENPPSDLISYFTFTPDHTRNDFWIRKQLEADREFAERSIKIRRDLGIDEELGKIGQEAGPFTLKPDGAGHSNYQAIKISTLRNQTALMAGSRTKLTATAIFAERTGTITREITKEATWLISNPAIATIDDLGLLTIDLNATGTISVAARWNDGTHEHSNTALFTITPRP